MTDSVSLKCTCGQVRGKAVKLAGSHARRILCYCDDCQTAAHALGRAVEILDPHGGTDIFPVSPAHFQITQGADKIECLRLSPKGLFRFYSQCCKTPVANSAGAGFPYAGVPSLFMDPAADGMNRDEALGPIFGGIQGRYAKGGTLPAGAAEKMSLRILLEVMKFLIPAFLKRQNHPSPFFNRDGSLKTSVKVLSKDEREKFRAQI